MARTLRSDKMLFLATLLLVGASVVMVFSASAVQATDKFSSPFYFMVKQLAWSILGVTCMFAVMRVDYHELRRPALIWTALMVTFVLLCAVFLFNPINGTRRWLSLGGGSLQPSELAKLAVILFTAALLERRMHRINDWSYALMPIVVVTLALALPIVIEPDFGTTAILCVVVAAMLFTAGLSYRYLLGVCLIALPAACALIVFEPYRLRRITAFLDPWADPLDSGFQTIQALLAVGSGGVFGRGLMGGIQKLYYIPEAHTDFIFAVIGEEIGLIGTTLIVICFGLILWRGMRASILAPDRLGALLAVGITTMMVAQALMNMSVVVALLPNKGIPLPFVSNGGSSLVINLVAMGILLNISQQTSVVARTDRSAAVVDDDGRLSGAEARA
jgi:cell division protein FtsW